MPNNVVCLTIDVDWACSEVVADMVRILDERRLSATFFCTHAGIELPGHERALHPNFRHRGDTVRSFRRTISDLDQATETAMYEFVVRSTLAFCPEAVGVRGHSLFYDSQLLSIYHGMGLQYDSTYLLPFLPGIQPLFKEYDILEIPIYFNDHFYLKIGAQDFSVAALKLGDAGLKVLQFHPNMVFINASTPQQYEMSRPNYHNAAKLEEGRWTGRGVRDLFLQVADRLASGDLPVWTLSKVNSAWRASGQRNF
jgi:hypothetical protein